MKKDIKYPDNVIMEVVPPSIYLKEFRDAFYKKLNDKERDVIQRIYDDNESASSIAKEYGVSKSRIYQVRDKAISKIRFYIGRKNNPMATPDTAKRIIDIAREEATKMIINEIFAMSNESAAILCKSCRNYSAITQRIPNATIASIYSMDLGELITLNGIGRKSAQQIIQELVHLAIQKLNEDAGETENE